MRSTLQPTRIKHFGQCAFVKHVWTMNNVIYLLKTVSHVCYPFDLVIIVFITHAKLFILSCPSSHIHPVISTQSFPSCPILCSWPSCPVHPFLSYLSCLSFPVVLVLSFLSCPSCPVQPALFIPSCPPFPSPPFHPLLSILSCQSCSAHPVLSIKCFPTFLSFLSILSVKA